MPIKLILNVHPTGNAQCFQHHNGFYPISSLHSSPKETQLKFTDFYSDPGPGSLTCPPRVILLGVKITFGQNLTDLHSSLKERQLQKSYFGEECRNDGLDKYPGRAVHRLVSVAFIPQYINSDVETPYKEL